MDSVESNTILPEEELQAALAEIESMSGEEVKAIPTFGDDDEDQGASLAESSALTGSGVTGSAAKADSASEADDTLTSGGSVADDELTAALAEAEAIAAGLTTASPSGGAAAEDSADESGAKEPPQPPAAAETGGAGKPAATATSPREKKKPRFKVGKQTSNEGVAEYRPPEERGDTEVAAVVGQPVAPLAKRVYRAVDQGLDTVNRPFEWLGGGARQLVGWVALVTLAVSILAILLMPLILPHRDAILFLQEKRTQLDTPPASPGEADAEVADSSP